jgi:hypothetical protein
MDLLSIIIGQLHPVNEAGVSVVTRVEFAIILFAANEIKSHEREQK